MYDTGHELIDTHAPRHSVIRSNHLGPNPMLVNPGGYEGGGNRVMVDNTSPEIVGNTIDGCESGINVISPPLTPYDELVPQLCRDNVFIGNRADIRDHNVNPISCGTTQGQDEEEAEEEGPSPRPGRGPID
jgi:hypothetical protein